MSSKASNKRKFQSKQKSEVPGTEDQEELIIDTPPSSSNDDMDDSDTTDSEESEYSGLEEEEEDTSDEESDVESIEEGSDSSNAEDDDIEHNMQNNNKVNDKQSTKDTAKKKAIPKEGTSEGKKAEKPGQGSTEAGTSEQTTVDEYEYDSSDEEDVRNTVGNIPMEWYKEYAHIGYNIKGGKIIKPKQGDEMDEFIKKMDDPNYWRTVKDRSTGQDVVLSKDDVDLVHRIKKGKTPDAAADPYEPWVDFFTHETMIHPVTNHPAHKRSFIPSLWEKQKVSRLVHAIKMGWIKPRKPKQEDDDQPKFYELWTKENEGDINKRFNHYIPAPKMALPGHEESYNPPPEYLLTEEEELTWKEQEPEERKLNFLPKKYSCLRAVPAYTRFINERFERCLDLYLCPRQRKMRMNVNPEDLIPKLPKPKDLQPFPTTQAVIYEGHTNLIRSITVDPTGQWLASGSDDNTVKFWEVMTGRCMKTLPVDGAVKSIAWSPNPHLSLVAIAVLNEVILLNPELGDKLITSSTDSMISSFETPPEESSTSSKVPVKWLECDSKHKDGYRLKIQHQKDVSQVTWHGKGDYFAVVVPESENVAVIIHQLSKRRSQNPFSKSKGLVQRVLFHPTRPFFFVATQRYVRVYNLVKQELTKKLLTNCKWVSSMAIHPGGDNVIIGSYDSRLSWFDMDLSTKPYQTLRHHKKALRQVCYHKRYPLFASTSDDGTVIVCHGMVYNDLLQNPLIVPVKVLRGHKISKDLGVLDCVFHPNQPWIFSSGADNTIRLFS